MKMSNVIFLELVLIVGGIAVCNMLGVDAPNNFFAERIWLQAFFVGALWLAVSFVSVLAVPLKVAISTALLSVLMIVTSIIVGMASPSTFNRTDNDFDKYSKQIGEECKETKWKISVEVKNYFHGSLEDKDTKLYYVFGTSETARKELDNLKQKTIQVSPNKFFRSNDNSTIFTDNSKYSVVAGDYNFVAAPEPFVKEWCKKNKVDFQSFKDCNATY